jgi:ubiquitin carboxyl-terminal hydrolase 4/11/15
MSRSSSNTYSNLEEEGRQVMLWISGKDDGVQRTYGTMPRVQSEWYIISTRWLNHWKMFTGILNLNTLDIDPDTPPGPINNSDILLETPFLKSPEEDFCNKVLKPGLTLHVDYEILPPKAWFFLRKKYGAKTSADFRRYSIEVSEHETQVEVTLKKVRLVYFHCEDHKMRDLKVDELYASCKTLIKDLNKKVLKIYNHMYKPHITSTRLWKANPGTTIEDLTEFRNTVQNSTSPVEFPGNYIVDNLKLEDAEVADEDLVVCEIRNDTAKSWAFKLETAKCGYCSKVTTTSSMILCDCKTFHYCTTKCKRQDINFHNCVDTKKTHISYEVTTPISNINRTYNTRHSESEVKLYERKDNSRMGLTGLQNLGNTCFMNSGLQCLSNTYELTQYILEDKYKEDMNPDNPLGSRCKLIREYATLIKEMWLETARTVSPWKFKHALSNFAHQFSGYHQHDSQELLSFLLDGIHEDLNRIRNKPYIEEIKTDGLSETEQAKRFWEAHLSRNQSIIIDLMYGQYRSEVVCPACEKHSLTFDPFLSLGLPIPTRKIKVIDVLYIQSDPRMPPLDMKIMVNSGVTVGHVREAVATTLGLPANSFILALLVNHGLDKVLEDIKMYSDSYDKTGTLVAYDLPPLTPNQTRVILDSSRESIYYYAAKRTKCTPSRILTVDTNLTCAQLHFEIFKYYMYAIRADKNNIQLRSPEEEDEDNDELRELFQKKFPELMNSTGKNLYDLTLCNPSKQANYSNNYSFYPSVNSSKCPYCESRNCNNCPLPFIDMPLQELLNRSSTLRIEAIWHSTDSDLIKPLNKVETHESVYEIKRKEAEMKDEKVSIYDCLDLLSHPKQLDEDNKWYCPKCKQHVQARKKMDIYKLPQVLVVHIMRFKESGYYRTKNNKTVTFPIEGLDMSSYVLGPQEKPIIYDLYAVSNHFGSMSFGHYTAYAKNPIDNCWYNFDDSSVEPIRGDLKNSIVSSAAYVLFYKRRS